jgi:hypothetical protein
MDLQMVITKMNWPMKSVLETAQPSTLRECQFITAHRYAAPHASHVAKTLQQFAGLITDSA